MAPTGPNTHKMSGSQKWQKLPDDVKVMIIEHLELLSDVTNLAVAVLDAGDTTILPLRSHLRRLECARNVNLRFAISLEVTRSNTIQSAETSASDKLRDFEAAELTVFKRLMADPSFKPTTCRECGSPNTSVHHRNVLDGRPRCRWCLPTVCVQSPAFVELDELEQYGIAIKGYDAGWEPWYKLLRFPERNMAFVTRTTANKLLRLYQGLSLDAARAKARDGTLSFMRLDQRYFMNQVKCEIIKATSDIYRRVPAALRVTARYCITRELMVAIKAEDNITINGFQWYRRVFAFAGTELKKEQPGHWIHPGTSRIWSDQ